MVDESKDRENKSGKLAIAALSIVIPTAAVVVENCTSNFLDPSKYSEEKMNCRKGAEYKQALFSEFVRYHHKEFGIIIDPSRLEIRAMQEDADNPGNRDYTIYHPEAVAPGGESLWTVPCDKNIKAYKKVFH